MARINPPETVEVHWVATIADSDAPTIAECNAGVDLTEFARGEPDFTETGNTADTANLSSKFNSQAAASYGGDNFVIEFYMDGATNTAYDTLARGTSGNWVVSHTGLATAGTFATNDVVWVYPGEIITRGIGQAGRDEVKWFTSEFAVTSPPNENYTLVG